MMAQSSEKSEILVNSHSSAMVIVCRYAVVISVLSWITTCKKRSQCSVAMSIVRFLCSPSNTTLSRLLQKVWWPRCVYVCFTFCPCVHLEITNLVLSLSAGQVHWRNSPSVAIGDAQTQTVKRPIISCLGKVSEIRVRKRKTCACHQGGKKDCSMIQW